MINTPVDEQKDILQISVDLVKQIPIIDTLLRVVCESTGMGFAAVARVTEDRWIACKVRDEINFGLEAGGELSIETTICNEIRDSGEAVIIDEVATDEFYCNHHTPKIYGIQSYISMPIFLKSGAFFGTLCAIDPRPAVLNNPKTIGMFKLFSELISFHLQALDNIMASTVLLQDSNRKLKISKDENRQYQHISNHTLQEPLRKIRVFSNWLSNQEESDAGKVRQVAEKINTHATNLSLLIKNLSDFSELSHPFRSFELTDLNDILLIVKSRLLIETLVKKPTIINGALPKIMAIREQMIILFYHLINNSIKFSKPGVDPVIKIYSSNVINEQRYQLELLNPAYDYCEISVEDNGIGIDASQLETIFDVFTWKNAEDTSSGLGIGLAQCRKIVRNHEGNIMAESEPGKGTIVTLILPVQKSS